MNTKQSKRFSEAELQEFKQIIDQKLEKAREQLAFFISSLEDHVENETEKHHSYDEVSSSLDPSYTVRLISNTKKFISHLERALVRIENRAYGICRETGKLISKARLKVVPHATLSIEAKQAKFRR